MEVKLSEKSVLEATINQDQDGEYGLYIVPEGSEICITEAELLDALVKINQMR